MRSRPLVTRCTAILIGASIVSQPGLAAQPRQGAPFTPEQIEQFLLTAEIVGARQLGQGVTNPWRLTLSDGSFRHDAAFQSVDVRRDGVQQVGTRGEIAFADSYHFNIAAYRLARLVGLGDMVPPTVERRWRGRPGALSWWIDDAFDEKQRQEANRQPPNTRSWQNQTYRMYLFGELAYDTDRNQTNILYTEADDDWRLWMIDFTRAFRPFSEIRLPERIARVDGALLERLRVLDPEDVRAVMGRHLTVQELNALMARRDLIVAYVDRLAAQRGAAAVLY